MADFELPGYEIYERIGKGGMATVYRALHFNLDREVAIKVMDPAMNSDEQFSERFVREARISAQLVHPHILQIYDVNAFDSYNYIAMELLSGGDLGDLIYDAMPQSMIYLIMEQMTGALDYAYSKGYVHRDIKPSNIMLRNPREYVLADFGIARAADSGTQMTQTGLMVGTPSYMSPEQAKGMDLDGRSDLYALAILFFEMLTKKLPYESDSPVTTAIMHLTEAIPTLPEQLSQYQSFIEKAMAKKADDRYQTGREMYAALMEASEGIDLETVLTPAAESRSGRSSTYDSTSASTDVRTSAIDQTRVSDSTPRSRPYKLAQTSQSQQSVVSGMYASRNRAQPDSKVEKKSGSRVPMLLGLVLVTALGAGGYIYWTEQQLTGTSGMGNVTGELASAYSAMNENNLPKAAAAFGKALSLDSGNAAATAGLAEIKELFEQGLTAALANRDTEAGRELYSEYSIYFGSSARWAEFGAELDQIEQEQRLAAAQEERITILLQRFQEQIDSLQVEEAALTLEQASALNPNHVAVVTAGEALIAARIEAAANEERWSVYTPEQREEFESLLAEAKTAFQEARYTMAENLLTEAAEIAPEMPALIAEQEQQTIFKETLADVIASGEAALAASTEDLEQAGAAVDLFKQVLDMVAENEVATAGLETLSTQFLDAANQAITGHDYAKAEETLILAKDKLPEQTEFTDLLSQIPELKQAYEQNQELQAANRARVSELLQQAAVEMEVTTGDIDKTADVAALFAEVLSIDAQNSEAQAGISTLIDQSVDAANAAIKATNFSSADTILTAAGDIFPGEAKIIALQQRLPGLEQDWKDKQAAAERARQEQLAREERARKQKEAADAQAREIAMAERRKALSLVSSGRVALSEGNLGGAQQAYDQVTRTHPTLPELGALRNGLQSAYLVAVRQQIEIKELDAALEYVNQGAALTPRNNEWAELRSEIELLQAGPARRRLGAY